MLSEALRLIRVYHDLSQTDLANRLKVSKSYLSEIESGTKTPTLDLIGKYGAEFKMPMSAILFFAENIDNPSTAQRSRSLVAKKILTLLRFLEERSEENNAARKRKLSR
jgi:transcriptional regulator with XRE-family HTH domain